jgi:hypothetical protein
MAAPAAQPTFPQMPQGNSQQSGNFPSKKNSKFPQGGTSSGAKFTNKRATGQKIMQHGKKFPGVEGKTAKGFAKPFRIPQFQCPFCEDNDHHYFACPKNWLQRVEALNAKTKCLNCARPGHTHYYCRSWTCRNCRYYGIRAYHHTGLCKHQEHPEFKKFKEERLKQQTNLPKLKPEFASEAKKGHTMPLPPPDLTNLGQQSKKRKMDKNQKHMVNSVSTVQFGTMAYVDSAFMLYPIEEKDEESEEDPESEEEVEELVPEDESDE